MTYPKFYKDFKCIADRCSHNCCIGWDIDIDPNTYKKYCSLKTPLGDRIKSNTYTDVEGAHFKSQNGRCPFLNSRGLCDIIAELGEDALCDICTLHPRFRNFYGEREEWGLGLCCEEAARLTLLCDEPFTLINDGGNGFCRFRARIFSILWGEGSIDEKVEKILNLCGAVLPDKTTPEWAEFFGSLERLDKKWDDILSLLYEDREAKLSHEKPFLQLLSYFIYRYLDPEDIALTAAFSVLSYKIIKEIFIRGEQTADRLCETARAYSAEIEYSEENLSEVFIALSAIF